MKVVIGQGSCGIASGAQQTAGEFERYIKERNLRNVTIEKTGCIGACFLEPIVDIYSDEDKLEGRYVNVFTEKVGEIVGTHLIGGKTAEAHLINEEGEKYLNLQKRVVMRNCGQINPESIDDYIKRGGYKSAEKAVKEMQPEKIIDEMEASGLRGRGGAGFPVWKKWKDTREQESDVKYVICNGDEGDPGAFIDRALLEGDPHNIIEGMIICAYAVGASSGIMYVRAEYPLAVERLEKALKQAEEKGFLGKNIFGSDFSFDINLRIGAGAFVCGEETALIASLEGQQGLPKIRPPYPSKRGYWKKPTNVNNIETLANVPYIIENGGASLAGMGTEKSKGTKVFALAGKAKRGGLIEVPMGTTLKEIVFDIAGGIRDGGRFKAAQVGGPSGGCIPEELLHTPVDYESITATGAIIGSGGIIVMDETTCMVDMARYFLDFTAKESCGKCNYCRIGTRRMLEILERITTGTSKDGDIEMLNELAEKVQDGSMCGLGQTAPNPVITTIRYFRNEYKDHIVDRKCTAGVCKFETAQQ